MVFQAYTTCHGGTTKERRRYFEVPTIHPLSFRFAASYLYWYHGVILWNSWCAYLCGLPMLFMAELFYVILATLVVPLIALPFMSLIWLASCCGCFGAVKCPYGWINCWVGTIHFSIIYRLYRLIDDVLCQQNNMDLSNLVLSKHFLR
jgi:hypothetical protein